MTFRFLSLRALSLCAVAALTLFGRTALAQMGPVTGVAMTPSTPPVSPENGLLLSDGVLLHGGLSLEAGYDSNVYYNETGATASPLIRVNPFLELTNTGRSGEIPAGLFFDLKTSLAYREYLSSDPQVQKLRSFTPSVSANLEHNSKGTFAFGLTDSFARIQDAPYLKASPNMIVRDNNVASAQLRWAPGGGRLQGVLRLTNTLDWFEEDSGLVAANSMTNELMVDASWRWLPKTALYVQVRQGLVSYFDPHALGATALAQGGKQSSFPLRAVLGVRGLITEKTSIALALGYQNAFYASGPSTSAYGFLGSTTAAAELTILPIFAARIVLGIRHDFQNSVIGNFYYDDGAYAALSYQAALRIIGQLWASYDYRRYKGLPPTAIGASDGSRNDNFIQAGATFDYHLKSWLFAGVSYTLAKNQSDLPAAPLSSGATYTKHQVFARVGLTY